MNAEGGRPGGDLALVAGLGPRRSFPDSEVLGGDVGDSEEVSRVLVLTSGSVHLAVSTSFGPHRFGTVEAPSVLHLPRSLAGAPDPCHVESAGGCEAVELSGDEARALLLEANLQGQAFRRLALSSVTRIIRLANREISRMFDVNTMELQAELLERLEDVSESQRPVPVSSTRIHELLEKAGLSFYDLPNVGLTARQVDAEAFLVQAGSRGNEAFLLAEGRLRVSLPIPRVGEEALAVLGPGQFVGEMALIDDEPRSADVIAHDGPATVYVLSRQIFRYLLTSGSSNGAPLLAGLAAVLCQRAEEAMRRLVAFRALAGQF